MKWLSNFLDSCMLLSFVYLLGVIDTPVLITIDNGEPKDATLLLFCLIIMCIVHIVRSIVDRNIKK